LLTERGSHLAAAEDLSVSAGTDADPTSTPEPRAPGVEDELLALLAPSRVVVGDESDDAGEEGEDADPPPFLGSQGF